MKISFDNPPNIVDIQKAIPGMRNQRVIFTYGDTIYNPYRGEITQDLIAHEQEHMRQQGDDPAGWWKKYLNDISFRADQEMRAYWYQYKSASLWPRLQRRALKKKLIADMSGRYYGYVITRADAEALLQGFSPDFRARGEGSKPRKSFNT